MVEWLEQQIGALGVGGPLVSWGAHGAAVVGLALLAWISDAATRRFALPVVWHVISQTRTRWDDALVEKRVFVRIAHFAPAVVVYLFASGFGDAQAWIERFVLVYMILVAVGIVNALLEAGLQIYQTTDVSREKPIRGYIQLGKLASYLVAGIFVVSTLLEREPWGLLTGLGALSAVLLLTFRDSILGFVASVQLAANDMIRRGDWIEVPRYGADGDVIEVGLHTVKVQNWDKTISTIPTHTLITDSFKNWRGMSESGGRRIKRALNIDIGTIRLADEEMLQRFEKFEHISEYIAEKRAEIDAYNEEHGVDTSLGVNGRRITNVGTFRAYVEAYLRHHPKIHKDMTFLVRQLQPTEKGLPIEIYVFSNDQVWASYEALQADLFDHILAVVPEFGLRVYQTPSGQDLQAAAREVAPPKRTT
jgi:miniconductance mechanosensitive channel